MNFVKNKSMVKIGKNNKIYFLLILLAGLLSCNEDKVNKEQRQDYTIVTDDLGRKVKFKRESHRFLPLAPSVTEMLYLVCDTSEIIGRTPNCNFPAAVFSKPVVNNYPPDLEKILYLKPDLVITKDGMLSLAQAEAIEKMGIPVFFQKYDKVEDIFSGLEELSIITGHEKTGKLLVDSLRTLMQEMEDPSKTKKAKKVLMMISKESYFVFGKDTYASDIIRMAGAVNAVDSIYNNPYPVLSAEYILKVNPDVIIGGTPVGLEKDFFELHPELKRTNAYKTKQYFTVNDDYLSRPGPRVVEAVKVIRDLVK
jgi:iron complex transport system substrate-binding protein